MKNENCGIYAIINKVNQKIYIGSSNNLRTRKMVHFRTLNNNKHHNEYLQRSFNKYGEVNFEFKILRLCKECDLLKEEQIYINKYNSTNYNCGYNICLIPGRVTMSDNIKLKISKSLKGKTLGIKKSEEFRINMRKYRLGKKHSEETKRRVSISKKGKPTGVKHWVGRKHTEESKLKMGKSHRQYQHFKEEWIGLYKQGISIRKISNKYKIPYTTVYSYIKIYI